MRRFRKCDTTKYRRRRQREKIAHVEHVRRRQLEEAERARRRRRDEEVYLAIKQEYHRQDQALVDVLARILYKRSPKHAMEARMKARMNELQQIFRMVCRF